MKVLNRQGFGYNSDIIAGVNWVTSYNNNTNNTNKIEVVNMSLGGSYSKSLNDAVQNSINANAVYVVAAGNDAANAANYSPANTPNALTVSAITDLDGKPGGTGGSFTSGGRTYYDDTFAPFSNWGSGVDLAAPGVKIYSTYKGSGYAEMSGTSMAAPHVAGAVALYRKAHPSATAMDVISAMKTNSYSASGSYGYTGGENRDGISEPLVNADIN